MTEDMIEQLESDLAERVGGWLMRIESDPDEMDPDQPATATFGVLIVDTRGSVLAVEMRINDAGRAELLARAFGEGGSSGSPEVFATDESVMVIA